MDFGYDDERPMIAERIASRTLDEALTGEHTRANGVTRGTHVGDQPVQVAASPVRVAAGRTAWSVIPASSPRPPAIGEHGAEVLAELGFDLAPGDLVV